MPRSRIIGPFVVSAVIVGVVLFALSSPPAATPTEHPQSAEIAIEHTQNLLLTLSVSEEDGKPSVIDFSQDGKEAVFLSLPESWKRREVRGATLKEAEGSAPAFGFIRWRLPPNATLSFTTDRTPVSLTAHNPSGLPLAVRVVRVHLETGTVNRTVSLFSDKDKTLW